MTDMLDHLSTCQGTSATSIRAFLHVLVGGILLASGAAGVARFRACFTDGDSHWAVAGRNFGRGSTNVRTIRACLQRGEMLDLPRSKKPGTMVRTRFTLAHAQGARLGALLHVTGMLVFVRLAGTASQGHEQRHAYPQKTRQHTTVHRISPLLKHQGVAGFLRELAARLLERF